MTQDLWKALEKMPNDSYNCNFAVMAFVDKGALHEAQERGHGHKDGLQGALDKLGDLSRSTFSGAVGMGDFLKNHGYAPIEGASLNDAKFQAGDIVTLNNHGNQHAAIITGVDKDGHILKIEQKPNAENEPLSTTKNEFQAIELRDPKNPNKLVSDAEGHVKIWRKHE